MLRLLHPDMGLLVESGYLYVPILFDPDIAQEIEEELARDHGSPGSGEDRALVEAGGRVFIRSLSLESMVEKYDRIDREGYDQLKRFILKGVEAAAVAVDVSPNGRLGTIVLKVMPHFVRMDRGWERGPVSDQAFMDFICGRMDIPERFMEEAARTLDPGPLLQRMKDLDGLEEDVEALRDGPVTGEALRRWLRGALGRLIVRRERLRIEGELREREHWGEARRKHVAAMLWLAHRESFELDGFGFSRIGSRDDYFVYKRTGEYVLKDYYDRSYRFPDCRVAVSTMGPLRPLVLEHYKHPFLLHHRPRQEICLSGYEWPNEVSAENIIRVLEDGINALLYGYDARRRNGYHSLDKTLYYVETIEFDDYRL